MLYVTLNWIIDTTMLVGLLDVISNVETLFCF